MNNKANIIESFMIFYLANHPEHSELLDELEDKHFKDLDYVNALNIMKKLRVENNLTHASVIAELRKNKILNKVLAPPYFDNPFVNFYPSLDEAKKNIDYLKKEYVKRTLSIGSEIKSDEILSIYGQKTKDETTNKQNLSNILLNIATELNILIKMPFENLKNYLEAVRVGDYVAVGAKPGHGKSLFLEHMFWHAPKINKKALFISMEMTEAELLKRHVLRTQGVDLFYTDPPVERKKELYYAIKPLFGNNVIVAGAQTPESIYQKIKEHKPDIVLIDYIQIVGGTGNYRETEYDRITKASMMIAQAKKELNCTVFVASQFRREEKGIPDLNSFKGSGQIGQDADKALVLWKIDEDDSLGLDRVFIDCVKNRQGKRFYNGDDKQIFLIQKGVELI